MRVVIEFSANDCKIDDVLDLMMFLQQSDVYRWSIENRREKVTE